MEMKDFTKQFLKALKIDNVNDLSNALMNCLKNEKELKKLIKTYKNTYEREIKLGNNYWTASVKGSIIGIVQLLTMITDKSVEDYFKEIFPEDGDDKK